MTGETVVIPSRLAVEARRRELSLEDMVLEALAKYLSLDPETVAEARLELAQKYLEEGEKLVDGDPVQASEKLYKVAEESIKAYIERLVEETIEILGKERNRGWGP